LYPKDSDVRPENGVEKLEQLKVDIVHMGHRSKRLSGIQKSKSENIRIRKNVK